MSRQPLALALVHHPVVDRRGDLVTTAVTNLDLHDIARTARTYGVERYYIVTPAEEQRRLVQRILAHWTSGHGAKSNPHRGEALALVRVVADLDEGLRDWERTTRSKPLAVLTGARRRDGISWRSCREMAARQPLLLVLGTGWGLAEPLFERGWPVLEPVMAASDYNHLPVRAAAAIILDRLLAEDER